MTLLSKICGAAESGLCRSLGFVRELTVSGLVYRDCRVRGQGRLSYGGDLSVWRGGGYHGRN